MTPEITFTESDEQREDRIPKAAVSSSFSLQRLDF